MEFYRIWLILTGHKWLLIWLPIIATCVGLGMTYVLPEQYESTALVLVRPSEDIKFNSTAADKKEILHFPLSQSTPIDAPSKTYMEVIKSPAVAVRIVEALHLDVEKPKKYDNVFDVIKDDVKTWFRDTFRTVLNYLKYGRDIPASPFDRALTNVEEKLAVAVRKDTYAFDITYRSSDPNEAAAVADMAAEIFIEHSAAAHRSEAGRETEFIQSQLEQSRKALEQARAAILAYKTSGGTFELASEYNEKLKNVSDLENTLAKTDGKLAGLKASFSKSSPDVIALEAQRADLQQQIATLREQLVAYPQKETQLNSLTLTKHLAEGSYEFFLKRYEEARVNEAAIVTEIRIVSRAKPALYPVKPLKDLYAGLSFVTALVVAVGWALFSEYLDPRVRTIHDLDDALGAPVLGVIPTLKRSRWTLKPSSH
jgi:uncharacterized protein involved in exopolysaccharide biosynthesis